MCLLIIISRRAHLNGADITNFTCLHSVNTQPPGFFTSPDFFRYDVKPHTWEDRKWIRQTEDRNLMELEMSDIYKDGTEEREREREVGKRQRQTLEWKKYKKSEVKIRVSEHRLLILCVSTLVRYGVCACFHQRRER